MEKFPPGKASFFGEKIVAEETQKPDEVLRDTLKKAYSARAKLFFSKLKETNIEKQIDKIDEVDEGSLTWDFKELGISKKAFEKIKLTGSSLHHIFCHPNLISKDKGIEAYYRNLAALSRKGLGQLLSGFRLKKTERPKVVAQTINAIMSEIVESIEGFNLESAQKVMLAEIGTEIQGTWVNIIGRGAAKNVEKIFQEFVEKENLIKELKKTKKEVTTRTGKKKMRTQQELVLTNDWKIIFSSEPDVAIYDDKDVLRIAIEIKGSMDKAGAQTRYGEAKKSFGKALRENPRCETIYLGSCYTESVIDQIEQDGQVRQRYNLIDLIDDETKREEFTKEIFKHQIRIM